MIMTLQTCLLRALCGAALSVIPASAAGITLTINPVEPTVTVSGATRVDLTISGLRR